MKSISVSIQGMSPLLQDKRPMPSIPVILVNGKPFLDKTLIVEPGRKNKIETIELMDKCHHDEKGIYLEFQSVFKTICNAGKLIEGKTRRQTMMKTFLIGIVIKPERIYIEPQQAPEPFIRPLKREDGQLVTAVSAMFNKWSLSFDILVNEDTVDIKKLKEAVELGGTLVGIGVWRPADTGGRFGTYKVTNWKVN